MNITFIIGNGFDLNLGLHTSYKDFYPYFKEKASKDNMIRKWIGDNEQLWSDLEEQLGVELKNIKEEQYEKFIDDKLELDTLLLDYLEMQQNSFVCSEENIKEIMKELYRSLLSFYEDLSIDDRNSVRNTLQEYKDEEYLYKFITFNYTDTLDRIVLGSKKVGPIMSTHESSRRTTKSEKISDILHVHGTINEDMILGVNDASQINNESLKDNSEFLELFVKANMNRSIGQRKIEKAKEIIKNSHIICVYGMSLGNTDKMWWEELVNWLVVNENNKLVVCCWNTDTEYKRMLPAVKIRLKNKTKNLLLRRGCGNYKEEQLELIKNRIFILNNPQIFDFMSLINNDDKSLNNTLD